MVIRSLYSKEMTTRGISEQIKELYFKDVIHYKVREDKRVVKAAYVVIVVNIDCKKEVLGIWIGTNESSKFWSGVLNDLKQRGIQDVLIFCVDWLNGFKEAIGATINIL